MAKKTYLSKLISKELVGKTVKYKEYINGVKTKRVKVVTDAYVTYGILDEYNPEIVLKFDDNTDEVWEDWDFRKCVKILK